MRRFGVILICLPLVLGFYACSSRRLTVDPTPETAQHIPERYRERLETSKILQFNDTLLNSKLSGKADMPLFSTKRHVSRELIGNLSKKYGMNLTADDDIALYAAGSGWLGVRHRIGGNTKKGVDCSGFTSIIYREVYGKQLERSSNGILVKNCDSISKDDLREGDLVFFRTSRRGARGTPTHVGVYLKNGKFIHASVTNGVIVSSLSEPYYLRTWTTGGRVK